jgi:hypothetical protein
MKAISTNILIWLFLLFVTGSTLKLYFAEKANSRRLSDNLESVTQEAEHFKTRDNRPAVKTTALVLTPVEIKRYFPEVKQKLENLYIPPQRAESYTETSQQLTATITAPVKDTVLQIIQVPSSKFQIPKLDTIRVLDYQDEWIKIHAALAADTGTIEVAAIDTIFTAIYRGERRKPAFWIFSRRKLQTAASNRNPYISINVVQSGVIKK